MMTVFPEKINLPWQFFVLAAVIKVSCSQTVSVLMEDLSSENGTKSQLKCNYSVSGTGYNLDAVRWYKGEDVVSGVAIAYILGDVGGASEPVYSNGYNKPAYVMTRDESSTILTIAEVLFKIDNGTYLCEVEYLKGFDTETDSTSATLAVFVPPNPDLMEMEVDGMPINPEEPYTATVGKSHTFSLAVKEIFPAATFEWTVDSSRTLSETTVNGELGNGLITSTSTATWIPELSDQQLKCVVTNSGGQKELQVTLMLDVTAPTTPTEPPTTPTEPPTSPNTTDIMSAASNDDTTTSTSEITGTVSDPTSEITGTVSDPTSDPPEFTTMGLSQNPPGARGPSKEMSTRIGVGVGCSCLVITVAGVCAVCWWHKHKHKHAAVTPEEVENENKNNKNNKGDTNGKSGGNGTG